MARLVEMEEGTIGDIPRQVSAKVLILNAVYLGALSGRKQFNTSASRVSLKDHLSHPVVGFVNVDINCIVPITRSPLRFIGVCQEDAHESPSNNLGTMDNR